MLVLIYVVLFFSHGQLYIALSRCTSSNRIKVVFPEDSHTTHTSNIVYTEVLAGLINTNQYYLHFVYLFDKDPLLISLTFCFFFLLFFLFFLTLGQAHV